MTQRVLDPRMLDTGTALPAMSGANLTGLPAVTTFISSQTASASATVDFTDLDTATYDHFRVTFADVNIATANQELRMRFGTGATPTWQSSNYGSSEPQSYLSSAAGGFAHTTGNYATSEFALCTTLGNAAADLIFGQLDLFNLGSTTQYKGYVGRTVASNDGDSTRITNGMPGGKWTSTTAVTAVRFYAGSGNITSGTFNLYGISNS